MVSDGDLIIMYVSMALARFRQVNKILLDNKGSSCDRTCMTSFDYFTKDVRHLTGDVMYKFVNDVSKGISLHL